MAVSKGLDDDIANADREAVSAAFMKIGRAFLPIRQMTGMHGLSKDHPGMVDPAGIFSSGTTTRVLVLS